MAALPDPYDRWAKVPDAIIRSPVLSAVELRLLLVAWTLCDTRGDPPTFVATVREIGALASLEDEIALAGVQRLCGLGLIEHRSTEAKGCYEWTVRAPSKATLRALCPADRLGTIRAVRRRNEGARGQ